MESCKLLIRMPNSKVKKKKWKYIISKLNLHNYKSEELDNQAHYLWPLRLVCSPLQAQYLQKVGQQDHS